MQKLALLLIVLLVFLTIPFAAAATLKGSIYNTDLELEKDVLVEIDTAPADTVPLQKFLSKDGAYSFELPLGKYILTAKTDEYLTREDVEITAGGVYILDVFLLPDFVDEDELWQETEQGVVIDTEESSPIWRYTLLVWPYLAAGAIVIFAVYRIIRARKKYGPLSFFRKKMKVEAKKTLEQHREELANEPGYLDQALEIIKKHDGRITQKELRKEMLYLSEAKVSLIITELEHKGKVEKIKKGRGNVIFLKPEDGQSENKPENNPPAESSKENGS